MFELFLKGINVDAHVECQASDPAVVVTTSAVERLPQGEDQAIARQCIDATHNR
ncbi:hypothetical protein D3C81_1859840 [compost metagenome]